MEREGGTPLGEANGEGRARQEGGVAIERTRRVRVAVACSPRGSNGQVRGSSEEGWGRRSGDGMGRAAGSSWMAMSGAQRVKMAAVVPLCSPRVNGGWRCVVVTARPSGLSAGAAKVSAQQGSNKRAAAAQRGCAAAAQQRERVLSSGAARAASTQRGERGREKESRERKREVNVLTRNFLKIFHGNSKKFEHKSCSKFKCLQLSF